MANQEIVKFIKDETAAGHSEADIRAALKGKGWADSDIDMAYAEVNSAAQPGQAGPAAGEVGLFIQPAWDRLNQIAPDIKELYRLFAVPILVTFGLMVVIPMLLGRPGQMGGSIASPIIVGIVSLGLSLAFAYFVVWLEATLLMALRRTDAAETMAQTKEKAQVQIWPLFMTGLLSGLIIALGFIALIIPGIYLLVSYAVSQNVVIDQGKKGMDALRTSQAYVKGIWWPVFKSILGLLAINVIAAMVINALSAITGELIGSVLSLGVNVVLFPYSIIYTYLLYERLKAMHQATPQA